MSNILHWWKYLMNVRKNKFIILFSKEINVIYVKKMNVI